MINLVTVLWQALPQKVTNQIGLHSLVWLKLNLLLNFLSFVDFDNQHVLKPSPRFRGIELSKKVALVNGFFIHVVQILHIFCWQGYWMRKGPFANIICWNTTVLHLARPRRWIDNTIQYKKGYLVHLVICIYSVAHEISGPRYMFGCTQDFRNLKKDIWCIWLKGSSSDSRWPIFFCHSNITPDICHKIQPNFY